MNLFFRYFFAMLGVLALGVFFFSQSTQETSAETIVRTSNDDKCTRTVFIQIEIFTNEDLTDGAMEAVANIWAQQINDRWNGPTDEAIQQAANELGMSAEDVSNYASWDLSPHPILQDVRQELVDKATANMEAASGGENCAVVNCCKIYFHTIIQVRKPGDDPTEGFYQVEVADADFRSYVRRGSSELTENQQDASGKWALEFGKSAIAHEAGHLMGIGDFYHDEEGEDGESHSVGEEGHESDLMNESNGWPKGEHLIKILEIAGQPCDCCTNTELDDEYMSSLAMADRFARDALSGNNCEYLGMAQTQLENQLKGLQATGVSALSKSSTASAIQARLDEIKKALLDCDKPGRPMTGTSATDTAIGIGTDGIPTAPFSYDSLECTTYGGGTVDFPIPYFPYNFGSPVIPLGSTEGPAGGAPTLTLDPTPKTTDTPENPAITTPGSTPNGNQTPAPGTTPENQGEPTFDLKVPSTPAPGKLRQPGGGTIVPFDKLEYDKNPNVVKPKDAKEGDKVKTPYDGATNEYYDEWDLGGATFENSGTISGGIDEDTITSGNETGEDIFEGIDIEDEPENKIPFYLVFKVEQDVVTENGTVEKGPAEKSVLKLGFPVPPKPGSGTVRTAENTNLGAGDEPRFVETDENGVGQIPIFADGFESGDITRWSDSSPAPKKKPATSGQPEKKDDATTYQVAGFTLDATPMKSRIVYLDTRFLTVEDTFLEDIGVDFRGLGNPDDENGNGTPDWSEKPNGLTPTPAQGGTPAAGEGDEPKPKTELPETVKPYVIDTVRFGDTLGITLGYKYHLEDEILEDLSEYVTEDNRYLKEKTDDPYYNSAGTWDQPYDDQWAIKSVGFVEGENGAWAAAGDDLAPVIVAFIDSGLDWNHADISWDNIWINEDEIAGNGIDDDMNGYVDDTIGWDFYTNNASPWDQDGHGTFTAGMVIATQNNGIGISGINPAAKIMVLKALNDFGHTRASYVAKAIKYATDNGARVINLSIGGEHQTYLERMAIKYAHDRGVVIVVAAGNEAIEIAEYGFAPYPEVIAVASSDFEGRRAFFSNVGPEIDIAAPGLDVLSLRARMTDFMRHLKDVPYEAGSAYVGEDNRYFRSSGTSFSAPIITGIASLILSMNPDLTNVEVKRMILNSARDVELPGTDRFTGYGVVDAVAALKADPAFEIIADIESVGAVQDETGAFYVVVEGTASANDFDIASIQIGIGETPTSFKEVETVGSAVEKGSLAVIPAAEFMTAPVWTIRLVVRHKNGKIREQWYVLRLG